MKNNQMSDLQYARNICVYFIQHMQSVPKVDIGFLAL